MGIMAQKAKFKEGDRVLLHVKDEDQDPNDWINDETGTVDGVDNDWDGVPGDFEVLYVVTVDKALWPGDDRLRDVPEDQMYPLKEDV